MGSHSELKVLGDQAYGCKKYMEAMQFYNAALELDGKSAVCWYKRALLHLNLKHFSDAVHDATMAIKFHSSNSKEASSSSLESYYFLRGLAHYRLGGRRNINKSLQDFREVLRISPDHLHATIWLKDVIQESVFLDEVEPEYCGARIGDGDQITLEFVRKMMDDLENGNKCFLHKRFAYEILVQATNMLLDLPSLVDVQIPQGGCITVCGDMHGQFHQLLQMFKLKGFPTQENPYLFNGNLVGGGSSSVEVVLTLFAIKCMCPSAMYLARGSNESKKMAEECGFEDEVKSKLGDEFLELFAEAFCCLPLAHVLNDKVFVVHGGLSTEYGLALSDIEKIDRFCELPEEGLMCDLLCSNPEPTAGRDDQQVLATSFGEDITKRFLEDNDLDLLVRSHQEKENGFEFQHDHRLLTVHSAPYQHVRRGQTTVFGAMIRFESPDMKPYLVIFTPELNQRKVMTGTEYRKSFAKRFKLIDQSTTRRHRLAAI